MAQLKQVISVDPSWCTLWPRRRLKDKHFFFPDSNDRRQAGREFMVAVHTYLGQQTQGRPHGDNANSFPLLENKI